MMLISRTGIVRAALLWLILAGWSPAEEPVEFTSASLDTLLVHAQRDGTTAEKRKK